MRAFDLHTFIQRVTLANMRSHGRRDIWVHCVNAPRCWHRAKMSADRWADHTAFVDIAPLFVCTQCGAVGAEVRPDRGAGIGYR